MADLTKATSRAKLKIRREPHWSKVGSGCYLGYRRMSADSRGHWIARFYDSTQARQHFRPLGDFSTLQESERYGEALKHALAWFSHLDRGGSASTVTMQDICMRYAEYVLRTRGELAAKDVRRRFESYVLSYEPFFGLEATKLGASHLDKWRMWLVGRPSKSGPNRGGQRSDSTQNRDISCLRAALNLALSDGLLTTDAPWKKRLAPIKGADRKRTVFLTEAEVDRLIRACSEEFRDFFTLLRLLPIRPGAAAALKVHDLNQKLKSIRIGKDKSNGSRWVALPPDTFDALSLFTRDKLPSAPLVGSRSGRHWTRHDWKLAFSRAAADADLPEGAVTYSIRHSGISALLHAGADPVTVAHIAGTSMRIISEFYAHTVDSRARTALAHLSSGSRLSVV